MFPNNIVLLPCLFELILKKTTIYDIQLILRLNFIQKGKYAAYFTIVSMTAFKFHDVSQMMITSMVQSSINESYSITYAIPGIFIFS